VGLRVVDLDEALGVDPEDQRLSFAAVDGSPVVLDGEAVLVHEVALELSRKGFL
jgi:hypothetical protein